MLFSVVFLVYFCISDISSFLFLSQFVLPLLLQRLFVPAAVTFVDVGQGDSIVLQTAFNREVYVIDTGGSLSFPKEAWQQRAYQEKCTRLIDSIFKKARESGKSMGFF